MPKYPIAPGAIDSLTATFDTNIRLGYNAKGINLETNTGPVSLVFQVKVYANPKGKEIEPAEYPAVDHNAHNH